ncbi:ABC transporter permease [Alkalicoccus luteus]|uniref:ABC transporter permease n=1 Tax=Alkalicoccus luteus TaxID=1237094 RepID=UPI004034020F
MHNNPMELWHVRRRDYWTLAIKYLRLIGNSGFVFTLYILMLFGSYYYGPFLEWLPETFPAALFFAGVFTLMTVRGRVRTFLKPADLVFILPMEKRLDGYFRSSYAYSFAMEVFWTLTLLFLLTPLFLDRIAFGWEPYLGTVAVLAAAKAWNLAFSFEEQKLQDLRAYRAGIAFRGAGTLILLYAAFAGHAAAVIGILAVLLLFYAALRKKTGLLNWERVIRIEENMVRTFFRMADNFTDVPQLRKDVKQRKLLSMLLKNIPYGKEFTYRYLFGRALIRSGDYSGIWIRLTAVGIVFVLAVHITWGVWLVAALFSYMTVRQLETMTYHFDTNHMLPLYPVQHSDRYYAAGWWIMRAGMLQAFLFGLAALPDVTAALPAFAAAAAVSAYSARVRMKKKAVAV